MAHVCSKAEEVAREKAEGTGDPISGKGGQAQTMAFQTLRIRKLISELTFVLAEGEGWAGARAGAQARQTAGRWGEGLEGCPENSPRKTGLKHYLKVQQASFSACFGLGLDT